MLILNSEQIRSRVSMPRLIDHLQNAFRKEYVAPPRQIAQVPGARSERLFLSMMAFERDGSGVAKLATVFPDNAPKGVPTIQAVVVVFSEQGTPLAVLDGTTVTRMRTGAASALASRYLSRADSSHLVVIGTGALAPYLALAHGSVRPIDRISICGRRPASANATASAIRSLLEREIDVVVSDSIDESVANADIVSCATSSAVPVLSGQWLKPGAFVDLVGSFSPTKRESDDVVVKRSRIFVDTFEGALSEAGDILDPLGRGVIDRKRIEGELADLVCGRVHGRLNGDEIIMFKSVGTAIEDLATAKLVISLSDSPGN